MAQSKSWQNSSLVNQIISISCCVDDHCRNYSIVTRSRKQPQTAEDRWAELCANETLLIKMSYVLTCPTSCSLWILGSAYQLNLVQLKPPCLQEERQSFQYTAFAYNWLTSEVLSYMNVIKNMPSYPSTKAFLGFILIFLVH